MNDPLPSPDDAPPSDLGPASQPVARAPQVQVQLPQHRPIVTYVLLGVTVVIFLLQYVGINTLGGDIVAYYGLKVNDLILRGQYWRLITPMFLHGSILHLGFNMYALYLFGPGLESQYGHKRFLVLYLLGGFAGNVMSFLFSDANSLGSSTAIFGLLGAEGVFIYQNRKILGARAQRGLVQLIVLAVVNFMFGLTPGSGIDNWGHLGGLLGGTLFAWFGGPILQVEGIYPNLKLIDRRQPSEVIWAAVGVLVLFGGLAAVAIFYRLR